MSEIKETWDTKTNTGMLITDSMVLTAHDAIILLSDCSRYAQTACTCCLGGCEEKKRLERQLKRRRRSERIVSVLLVFCSINSYSECVILDYPYLTGEVW